MSLNPECDWLLGGRPPGLPTVTDSLVPAAETTIGRPMATARRLVNASVSDNTRRAYAGALGQLDVWLDGRRLEDARLAAYLAELHDAGRAPASASMTVAAVRFPREAGRAAELTSRGASTADVMLAGNWKTSRMVAHYSAGATAERGAVARFL